MNIGLKIARFFIKKEKGEIIPSKLEPLYPQNIEKDHFLYVNELNRAIENKKIKNIALTGSYGSGKSSVLSGFEEDKPERVVRISFSTLGTNIQKYILDSDKSDDPSISKSEHDKLNNLTNLIQKEVIKQLLFKEKYKNIPYSKYQRVSSPNTLHVLFSSGFISFLLIVVLVSTEWFPRLLVLFGVFDIYSQLVLGFISFVFLGASIAVFILTLGSKLKIDKIGGSSVSLSLSGENNYFDEYLDEIIYFFVATKYDVVIFEDIDRFDNLYIFENLRQLNAILNGSKQIDEKHITFIYAVKDSIFSKPVPDENGGKPKNVIDDGELEEKNTNRTKFFDLIIPIVPFITHSSSRDIILSMFNKYELSKEVVGVVAKYITDMRLIKNIYNEFVVFENKIMNDNEAPGLSLDKLFAIVVYKNRYLQDFEDAKNGSSLLDKAYNASRRFVNDTREDNNIRVLEKKIQLKSINAIAVHANPYGTKLLDHIDTMARQNQLTINSYTFGSVSYSKDDLLTEKFWREISDNSEGGSILTVSCTMNSPRYPHNMFFTIADIIQIVGGNVHVDALTEEDSQRIDEEIETLERESKEINYKNMKKLMEGYSGFRTQVRELVGDSSMLYGLIESGYIDEDYTYYMSVYHAEKISMKARNFILQNIRFNIQDVSYQFKSGEDIENMLSEVGSAYLNDQSMYNISIVDYLLPRKLDKRVDYIIKNLSEAGPSEINFIDAYMKDGKKIYEFTKRLSGYWSGIFKYIVIKELDDQIKVRLISAAILGNSSKIDYELDDAVSAYLSDNIEHVEALTIGSILKKVPDPIRLLRQLNVHIANMNGLNEDLREIVIQANAYEVNKENLYLILESPNLSLSNIKNINQNVYLHILNNLNAYLGITTKSKTLEADDNLKDIINDVAGRSPENLERCLMRADSRCQIEVITTVTQSAWPYLFGNMAVSNTLGNILPYYNELKSEEIDGGLATYLNSGIGISEGTDHNIEEKKDFAFSVLRSGKINDTIKASLVQDLSLGVMLDVEDFSDQEGQFYGDLLRIKAIEDTAENYNSLINFSWKTKEAYIANSEEFISYMDVVELNSEDITGLMKSEKVTDAIKEYLVRNAANYDSKMSQESASLMAEYALDKQISLDATNLSTLLKLTSTNMSIKLINLSSAKISRDDMITLLAMVGGLYADLTKLGRRLTLEDNQDNEILIHHLESLGMVSSHYSANQQHGGIRVNMRNKWI